MNILEEFSERKEGGKEISKVWRGEGGKEGRKRGREWMDGDGNWPPFSLPQKKSQKKNLMKLNSSGEIQEKEKKEKYVPMIWNL